MNDEQVVAELVAKHCPEHNEIDAEREEGHYHCEQCADTIKARFRAAIREAITLTRKQTLEEAAKVADFRRVNYEAYANIQESDMNHMARYAAINACGYIAAELRRLADTKIGD